jgi:hypothetical protein
MMESNTRMASTLWRVFIGLTINTIYFWLKIIEKNGKKWENNFGMIILK